MDWCIAAGTNHNLRPAFHQEASRQSSIPSSGSDANRHGSEQAPPMLTGAGTYVASPRRPWTTRGPSLTMYRRPFDSRLAPQHALTDTLRSPCSDHDHAGDCALSPPPANHQLRQSTSRKAKAEGAPSEGASPCPHTPCARLLPRLLSLIQCYRLHSAQRKGRTRSGTSSTPNPGRVGIGR